MVDWITISNNSGNSGTTVITVTAATYDELITRTTSLVVNTVNTSLSESVSISQAPREVEIVTVSPSTISAPKEGGAYTFNIISNGAWTISYPDEWITISQSAGTGSATITVDIPQNLVLSGKSGNIEVSTRDNTAIVQVSQERNTGYINVEPSVLEFVYSGGSRAVIVGSNTDWTISNVPNWVSASTLSGNGNSTVLFTITGTPSSDRTSVIKFSVLDEDAYLTISQSSTIPYLYFENSAMTFNNAGGTQINPVISNVQWEILPNLTFEIISGGTVTWSGDRIYYSKNGNDYLSASTISVSAGDNIEFVGYNSTISGNFGGTSRFKAKGNINSLKTGTTSNFGGLFSGCTAIVDASELVLPATTLSGSCYGNMFANCTNLTKAPALPATSLTGNCYYSMFNGCSSLTTAPELPATTLGTGCYNSMFANCTSLLTAPELPATTLASNCYNSMFSGCTGLITAPYLPATTLQYQCYENMFRNCTNLITVSELPATTLAYYCYNCMFQGCTSLTTAPELPATTLANYCYRYMFNGCTNLNYIKCLATDKSASNCLNNWVSGVQTTSGTFVKDANTNWGRGGSGIPDNWTVQNA